MIFLTDVTDWSLEVGQKAPSYMVGSWFHYLLIDFRLLHKFRPLDGLQLCDYHFCDVWSLFSYNNVS